MIGINIVSQPLAALCMTLNEQNAVSVSIKSRLKLRSAENTEYLSFFNISI